MIAASWHVLLVSLLLVLSDLAVSHSFFDFASRFLKKKSGRVLQAPPPSAAPTYSYRPSPAPSYTLAPGSSSRAGPGCDDATEIRVPRNVEWWQFDDSGSNEMLEPEPSDGVCPLIAQGAPSQYYRVPGNERCFNVTTFGSNFDTVLAVYKGNSCEEEMTCYAQNDDYYLEDETTGELISASQSKLSFHAKFDGDYWIVLAGYGGAIGNYEIDVMEVDCPGSIATNSECSSAVEVSLPYEYTVSFDFLPLSNLDDHLPDCPVGEFFERTLWYKIVGDGSCFQAKVSADDKPGVDVPFALVQESSADCVMTGCPLSFSVYYPDSDESMIQWRTDEGTNYFIVLVDPSLDLGSVTVSFDSVPCPEQSGGGTCDAPIAVSSFPYFYIGSFGFMAPTPYYELFYECPQGSYEDKRMMWFQLPLRNETYCLDVEVFTWDTYVDIVESYDGFTVEACHEKMQCHRSISSFPRTVKVPAGAAYYSAVWSPNDGPLSLNFTTVECPVAPPNDDCTNATVIEVSSKIEASLEFAKPLSSRIPCTSIEYGSPSLWYKIDGTGSCMAVNVTADAGEVKIGVMEGRGCFDLTCLGFSSIYDTAGVSFLTKSGSSYFVAVSVPPWSSEVGSFTLTAEDTSACPTPPDNDSCEDSEDISSLPASVSGAINLARPYQPSTWRPTYAPSLFYTDDPDFYNGNENNEEGEQQHPYYDDDYYYGEHEENEDCYFYEGTLTTWYRIETAQKICLNITVESDFSGSLVVMKGDSCQPLDCSSSSRYWFYGGSNTFYHSLPEDSISFFVVTKEPYEYGGMYDLTFNLVDCPELDSCSEAGSISEIPFVTFKSNAFAFPESHGSPTHSCRLPRESRTQWYHLPNSLAQDRCFSVFLFAEFATALGVFGSAEDLSCEDLSCLYSNTFFNGFARFRANSSSIYLVVGGASQHDSGDYILSVDEEDCGSIPTNTNCSSAEDLGTPPATFDADFGRTAHSGAYMPVESCYLYSQWKTLWYTVPVVSDETCLRATPSQSQIGIVVFNGTCSRLGCVSGNDEDRHRQGKSWRALPGVQYVLAAFAESYVDSKIAIDLTTLPCTSNDLFSQAIHIEKFDFWHSASNELSRIEPPYSGAFSCPRFPWGSRTNWYKFEGTGSCMSVNVFADFDTYVAVYVGNYYGEMTCVASAYYSYGSGAMTFVAQNGTEYFILVGGNEYSTGEYTLVVTTDDDCEDTSNNSCENAAVVDEESFPLSSSNMQTSPNVQHQEFPGDCYLGYQWHTSWYQLQLNAPAEGATCLRLSIDMEGYGRAVLLNGTCESPRCMQARDGYDMSLSLKVNSNETYLLGVSGRERGSSFTVDLVKIDCVGNDLCDTASSYRSFPIVEKTTHEFGVPASWDSPGHACPSFTRNSRGTWYRFEGTGACVTVQVWGIRRGYIGVYTGSDCGGLSCITEEQGSDQQAMFRASIDTSYFIFVGESYRSSVGEYTVVITESAESCAPIPTNVDCESADTVGSLPATVQASLPFATFPTSPTAAPSLYYEDSGDAPSPPAERSPWDVFGPGALNNLNFFFVEKEASFACGSTGSRCAFNRNEFVEVDDDGGAIADQMHGSVWTTSVPEIEVLHLRGCESGECIVACFMDCLCILPEGTGCPETVISRPAFSPAPSSVSRTSPPSSIYDSCFIPEPARVLWYVVPAVPEDEGNCVRARLNGGRESIVVFSGECDELDCIGPGSYNSREQQEILWEPEPSVPYYIAVRSPYGYFPENRQFVLEIESVPCPVNDFCVVATQIVELPFVDVANNEFSSPALVDVDGFACNRLQRFSRGMWFAYLGTGECVSVYVWSSIGAFLGVYTGEDCESMSCLAQERYDDRAIHFFAEEDQVYRLLVAGASAYETGDFAVTVTRGSNCPAAAANTNCSQAMPVTSLPFEVEQSSELVPIFRQAFGCGAWFDRKKMFYSIQFGESTCLSVSVQSTRTVHYRGLQVSVFEASSTNCTNLMCVKEGYWYHSEQDGTSSVVSFKAMAQKLYYVIVMDEEFSSGTEFKLTVQQKECVGNDSCSTSKLIDAPFFEESTTEFSLPRSMYYNSSSLPVPSPHNSTTRDPYNMTTILPYNHSASVCAALDEDFGYNYYKLSKAPEEACLRVTVLSRSQSSIGVMYGDCSSLSCIAQRQFGSENGDPSLKFLKESGKEYIVAVGSYSRQGGPYIVNIETSEDCPTTQENSSCEKALPISSPTTYLTGGVTGTLQPFDGYVSGNCGLYHGERTLWYSLGPFPEDNCVKGSFSSKSYRSELLLVSGTSCDDDLFCVGSFSPGLSWKVREEEMGWLVVRYPSYISDADEFEIRLEEVDCSANDVCESSKILTELPIVEQSGSAFSTGANLYGNATNSSYICPTLESRYGDFQTKWYQVTAVEDGCIDVSVFGASNLALGVHGGSCGGLTCVALSSGFGALSAAWQTTAGETYHIGVGVYGDNDFVMLVDDHGCDDLQTNSACASAQTLGDSPVTGSTDLVAPAVSLIDGHSTDCDFHGMHGQLWYEIDSSQFQSNCVELDFSGDIAGGFAILAGTGCDALSCVHVSNPRDDPVTLFLTNSSTYYVVVFHSSERHEEKGNDLFSLRLSEVECTVPYTCQQPNVIEGLPFVDLPLSAALTVDGNSSDLASSESCDGIPRDSNSSGYNEFWYSFMGVGGCLSAFVWSDHSQPSHAGIYQGDNCSDLKCVARVTYQAEGTHFFAAEGQPYKLLVVSRSRAEDTIVTLTESGSACQESEPHSFCGTAKPIPDMFHTESGDLLEAAVYGSFMGDGDCYVPEYSRSLWYRVKADDLGATNETCIQASLESVAGEINVFTGSSCGSLRCTSRIYAPGTVSWKLEPGETYYIAVVSYYSDGPADFVLTTSDADCRDVVLPTPYPSWTPYPSTTPSPTWWYPGSPGPADDPSRVSFEVAGNECQTTVSSIQCDAVGVAIPPNGGLPHRFVLHIVCELSSQAAFDFRAAEHCRVEIELVDGVGAAKDCKASVCPAGFGPSPVSVDCGGDELGRGCSSMDCNFECNGPCLFGCEDSGPDCYLCRGVHGHDEEEEVYYESEEGDADESGEQEEEDPMTP